MRFTLTRAVAVLATLAAIASLFAGCGSSSSGTTASAIDRAFVRQMIPHHGMAVEMATTAQKRGEHSRIHALAGSIIATQRREIAEMKPIAGRLGVQPDAMPMHAMHGSANMTADAKVLGISMDAMGMTMDMTMLDTAKPFDRAFIDMMIPHHQGAIRMARAELAKGQNTDLKQIAKGIIADQAREIHEMNTWRKQWYGSASPAGGAPAA